MENTTARPKGLSGPRALYRRKVRSPVSVNLTPEGHAILGRTLRRTRLSRSDLFEGLLRTYGEQWSPSTAP